MGCGSSGNVVPGTEDTANGHAKMINGNGHHDSDGLPTVVLPDTPALAKPRKYPFLFFTPSQIDNFRVSKENTNRRLVLKSVIKFLAKVKLITFNRVFKLRYLGQMLVVIHK